MSRHSNQYYYGDLIFREADFDPFRFKMEWDLTKPYGFVYKTQFKLLVTQMMRSAKAIRQILRNRLAGTYGLSNYTSGLDDRQNEIRNFCLMVDEIDIFDKWLKKYRIVNFERYIRFTRLCVKELGYFEWDFLNYGKPYGSGFAREYRVLGAWDQMIMKSIIRKSRLLNNIKDGEKTPSSGEKEFDELLTKSSIEPSPWLS